MILSAIIMVVLLVLCSFVLAKIFQRREEEISRIAEEEEEKAYSKFEEEEDEITPPETPIPKMIEQLRKNRLAESYKSSTSDLEKMMMEYREAKEMSKRISVKRASKKED